MAGKARFGLERFGCASYDKAGMEMNQIKKLRKKLNLSARQFGIECGLTGRNISRTVYRWEDGSAIPSLGSRMLLNKLKIEHELLILHK